MSRCGSRWISGSPGTIRSVAQGAFPEINVGRTAKSLEVFVFAPGLDAKSIDVVVERNVLKVSGARTSGVPRNDNNVQLYANERPEGKFVRAVSLPDDADTARVEAKYKDFVNAVTRVARLEGDFLRTETKLKELKANSKDPGQQRLVGTGEDLGKLLGLDKDWSFRAIKAVGNYGEMFERNVGPKSVLKLPRGSNNLWNKGGLIYAPPVR